MTHAWTESQLARIARKHPELKKSPIPSIDTLVLEFLRQHDVYVEPPCDRISVGEFAGDVLRGVITVTDGVDAGATMQVEKNQRIIAGKQEWTSWKQWTLSHNDWPDFKEQRIGRLIRHNNEIDQKLQDHDLVDEWSEIFREEQAEAQKIHQKNKKSLLIIALGIAAIGILGSIADPQSRQYLLNGSRSRTGVEVKQ